jgi:hypothetical protein
MTLALAGSAVAALTNALALFTTSALKSVCASSVALSPLAMVTLTVAVSPAPD